MQHSPERRRLLMAAGALLLAPAHAQESAPQASRRFASALPLAEPTLEGFRLATPEAQGFDSARLTNMTRVIENAPHRVFSMMIARNGHVVYEMLAGDLPRDAAHYVMSVTKSLTSAMVGAAIDGGLIASEDQAIGELLPKELFGTAENLQEKAGITVRQVLNMSALDVPHIVGNTDPAVAANYLGWVKAKNRVEYALGQRKVQRPMNVMDYTDLTCSLVNGVIHYKSGTTVLEFANQRLFSRMDFRNQEWMGQDPAGIDQGGYGIRLRPIDMLKFGQLYLQQGMWNGQRLLNPGWIDKAYVSQISPRHELRNFYSGYSNYWWHARHRGAPKNIVANGWKGQRISIFPELKLVVTLTGVIESGEAAFYDQLVSEHVLYALRGESLQDNAAAYGELQAALARMREKPLRLESVEYRMRPEVKNKERRKPWHA
ncbi:MAG TPA: serine hydrolase [Burkholderiales bacterium]|nr:serine hydrolase [Burkholderiales bacterium]